MKKIKLFLFSLIVITSLILVPIISKKVVNADINNLQKSDINNESIKENTKNKEKNDYIEYSIKFLEKYENNLIYNLSYPIFKDKEINVFVDDIIKNFVKDFKSDFIGQKLSKDEKFLFKLDTEVGNFENSLLFLKFDIQRNYNTYPNPIKSTNIYIIDLNQRKIVDINEFLKNGYKELLFQEVSLYFYNNYGLNINKKSENYNDIKPSDENYNKIFVKNNQFFVFFYDYKKEQEEFISISAKKIYNYIKPNYLEVTTSNEKLVSNKNEAIVSTTIIVAQETETTSIDKETETTTQNIENLDKTNYKNENLRNKRVIDKSKPMVALTFDDGPNGSVTNRILELLEQNNSAATFFVNARRLDKDKEIIKKIDNMGFQIGNHTANHKNLTKISNKEIKNEIDFVNQKLKNIIGKEATIVRVPYGAVNNNVKKNVNYPLIMWSIDTRDWKVRNSQQIQNQVLGKVKDGDIILMHDLYKETADACEVIIPKLVEQGFQLVTIDELFYYKDIQPKNGEKYFNGKNT